VFADGRWPELHLSTLHSNYRRSAYWGLYEQELRELLFREQPLLADKNAELIRWVASRLGIPAQCVRASSLGVREDDATQRLVALVRAVGGTVYVHGRGAANYQDETVFAQQGIDLQAAGFVHPVYRQMWGPEFVPGFSVLDLMFNEGPNARRIIEEAVENSET
jgi:hypothetical protein